MMVTTPSGVRTYIGRRGRLTGTLATPPAPPAAVTWQTMGDRLLQASPLSLPAPIPFRVLSTNGSGQLTDLPGFIVGWAVRETSGSAAAAAELWDGQNTSSQLLASIGLVTSGGSVETMSPPGWTVRSGLYLHVASGAFDGVVWLVPVEQAVPQPAPPLALPSAS